MNRTILDRNLLSLGSTDPFLAARIGRAEESRHVRFLEARTGKPVAACGPPGDKPKILHSLFDPEREGLRLLETFPPDGFYLFLGFGCGYQVLPFLDRKEISQIVILETDLSLMKSIFGAVDLRNILLDPKVRFLVDPSPEELKNFILSSYFPALAGDLRTVFLRPRFELDEDFFQGSLQVIRESIDTLSDDFTVQTHFGKKWFINTLSNLEAAGRSVTVPVPRRTAVVTGAGPSLEDGIPEIRRRRGEVLLIATDTSLPVLLGNNLVPDLVVSIDCQHITYNHFMAGYPKDVPLVLDLASPPVITKLTPKVSFFTSGHPFSQYVCSHWRRFPFIDTSGGNVSHAAVSLADRMGASRIFLYGSDFSYPEGKSYARGAYIYPYFASRETRFDGLESLFVHFLFRNRTIGAVRDGKTLRYTTKPMISYKERLELASRHLRAELIPVRGRGEPITVHPRLDAGVTSGPRIFSSGTPRSGWRTFLESYRSELAGLPGPKAPVMNYLYSLSQKERNLWMTILPSTAVFVKELRDEKQDAAELLNISRAWTLNIADRYLSRK